MIHSIVRHIACYVDKRKCPDGRPAARDLSRAMRDRGRRVDAITVGLRQQRKSIATGDFLEDELLVRARRDKL